MDFPDSQKALRRSLPPAGGKEILIVFPAACTWEKLFARSERRGFYTATSSGCVELNRAWPLDAAIARSTEAQSGAMLIQKRCKASFLTHTLEGK